jgi:methyl-accepting chemotaxis protein
MTAPDLDELRRRGLRFLAGAGWLCTGAMALLSIQLPGEQWPGLLVSALINLLPTWCAIRQRFDLSARITIGLAAAVHPAVLVYLFRDSTWQMDMHMYFFVCLAALTVLCDWRPILAASVLVAVHHLALLFVAPEWVFDGRGDFERVIVHAVAVLLQFAVLAHITNWLRRLIVDQSEDRARSDALAEEARAAQLRAEDALAMAKAAAERERRDALERAAAAARKAELLGIASEFEASVANVASLVSRSAGALESTARDLSELARDTHQRAGTASGTAAQASSAATGVAEGVTSLARSIDGVAINVGQQGELSDVASRHVARGGEALQILFERTKNIARFATMIDTVAARTNLLAMNATLEAVRAGEAGRGFAIVAGEVRALAEETTSATAQISALIGSVDAGAADAERALADISGAVGDLAGAADKIRSGIEDQLRSASLIDHGARDAAAIATGMAEGIHDLAMVASAAGELSTKVEDAATSLMRSAGTLDQATRRFVAHLRTA